MNLEKELTDYPPDKMTPEDWREYSDMVDAFAKAKREQDYIKSDSLRKELLEWNRNTSDHEFIKYSESGHYIFHPFFESVEHFWKRTNGRKKE